MEFKELADRGEIRNSGNARHSGNVDRNSGNVRDSGNVDRNSGKSRNSEIEYKLRSGIENVGVEQSRISNPMVRLERQGSWESVRSNPEFSKGKFVISPITADYGKSHVLELDQESNWKDSGNMGGTREYKHYQIDEEVGFRRLPGTADFVSRTSQDRSRERRSARDTYNA